MAARRDDSFARKLDEGVAAATGSQVGGIGKGGSAHEALRQLVPQALQACIDALADPSLPAASRLQGGIKLLELAANREPVPAPGEAGGQGMKFVVVNDEFKAKAAEVLAKRMAGNGGK